MRPLLPRRIALVAAEGRLFGTDGVRGKANHYPVTPEIAFSLGRAGAEYLQGTRQGERCYRRRAGSTSLR